MNKWISTLKATRHSLANNLSSVLIYLGIIFICYGIADMVEKKLGTREKNTTRRMAVIGVFSALAFVLMYFEIPLFFVPDFYKIDASEVPIMIGTFILGPTAGIAMEGIKILLKLFFKGTSTAFVGDFANVIIGIMYVVPAGCIYYFKKTRKMGLLGMVAGTVLMSAAGCLLNAFLLIPTYGKLYGLTISVIVDTAHAVNPFVNDLATLIVFAVLPFNIIKGVMITLITFLLYKKVSGLFR